MTIDPDKYVVFKAEDLHRVFEALIEVGVEDRQQMQLAVRHIMSVRLDDAVVIRRQDAFAGPALHAYAANIQLVGNLMGGAGSPYADQLKLIADYFHEQAVMADEMFVNGTATLPD